MLMFHIQQDYNRVDLNTSLTRQRRRNQTPSLLRQAGVKSVRKK